MTEQERDWYKKNLASVRAAADDGKTHYVGDSCPGGHMDLVGAMEEKIRTLTQERDEARTTVNLIRSTLDEMMEDARNEPNKGGQSVGARRARVPLSVLLELDRLLGPEQAAYTHKEYLKALEERDAAISKATREEQSRLSSDEQMRFQIKRADEAYECAVEFAKMIGGCRQLAADMPNIKHLRFCIPESIFGLKERAGKYERLMKILVEAAVPLEALALSVTDEVSSEIMESIRDKVLPLIHNALNGDF